MTNKKLPIGLQSISRLIEGGFTYVDKTPILHELVQEGLYYFLARPRRFGKTLLCSTFEQIFFGNKELFSSCAIYTLPYSWQKHPVIYLNFALIASASADELKKALLNELKNIALQYDVHFEEGVTLGQTLKALIKSLSERSTVALLIDEYDTPILRHINNEKQARACRDVLGDLFSALKDSHVDSWLRFVFITGVTKFSKTSIFSGLNNLTDLSLDPRVATLLGYTEQEVRSYFTSYIKVIACEQKCSEDDVMKGITAWYNGYRFADPRQPSYAVYNPYSVMLYLQNRMFDSYWFDTGTPTFFIDVLRHNKYPIMSLEGARVHKSDTIAFDIGHVPLLPLLWQTGYLTIKSYDQRTKNYTLTFPNEEVRVAFFDHVIKAFAQTDSAQVSSMVRVLHEALNEHNLDVVFTTLQQFFASIPYDIHIPTERYYQSIFFSIMMLAGADVHAEERTSMGRIDAVLTTDTHVYILEFKVHTDPAGALQQILDKGYHEKYLLLKKPITLVGVQFDTDKRTIVDWQTRSLQTPS